MRRIYLLIVAVVFAFSASAQVLLSESFENDFPPTDWALRNVGTSEPWFQIANADLADFFGDAVQDGDACAMYYYDAAKAANTWLITKGLSLTGGTSYTVSFFYKVASSEYPERMKVTVGTANTTAAQTTAIWTNGGQANLINEDWAVGYATYTPAASGTFYFGFNCYSLKDEWYLLLDNIKVQVTPTTPPNCVANIFPANATTGVEPFPGLTFKWNTSPDADTYDFYLSETNPPGDIDFILNASTDSVDLSGLEYNKTYYWYVVPKNAAGDAVGCASNVFSFTTKDPPPLTNCTSNIAPADGATVSPYPATVLKWTPEPNAVLYGLYIGTTDPPDPDADFIGYTSLDSIEIPASSGFLADETTYYWYVVPINGAGEPTGCEANVTSFTTPVAPVVPSCTTLVEPIDGASNVDPYPDIKFDWAPAADATDYMFYLYDDAGGTSEILSGLVGGDDSIFLSGLDYGITYYWKIIPVNAAEIGPDDCALQSFTTKDYPAAPANDNCSGAIALNSPDFILGTTIGATESLPALACSGDPEDAGDANDDIWYSFVATGGVDTVEAGGLYNNFDMVLEVYDGDCNNLVSIACSDTSFGGGIEAITLSGLTPGKTYRVRAYNWYSGSSTTGEIGIRANGDATVPVTLGQFTGKYKDGKNILNWETKTETNNSGFDLQRSIDGINYSTLAFVKTKAANGNSNAANSYEYVDNKPLSGSNYYRLKQINKDGKSSYSQVVRLFGLTTNRLEFYSIYPNPAKSLLNMVVAAPKAGSVTVSVADMAGKTVLSQKMAVVSGENILKFNTQSLSAGSYLIKVACADGCESTVKKFIKN